MPSKSVLRTLHRMSHSTRGRHLDTRLTGRPRDYFDQPHRFGIDPSCQLRKAGDPAVLEAAWAQHRLVLAWRERGQKPTAAELGQRFGFSKQTWSRITRGERWAGVIGLIALMRPPPRTDPQGD